MSSKSVVGKLLMVVPSTVFAIVRKSKQAIRTSKWKLQKTLIR